ncbi:hypothetical protein [Streptomyces sp. NPDC002537]
MRRTGRLRGSVRALALAVVPLAVLAVAPTRAGADAHTAHRPPTALRADAPAPSASWTQNGGRIDVFRIGPDHRLYERTWAGSGWSDWTGGFDTPLGGLSGTPGATWTADGSRLDVFATGAGDGRLYQKTWAAPLGWSAWSDLGGSLFSAPSASWRRNGERLDVFAVGTDHRLYQRFWANGSGWSGWTSYDAPAGGLSGAPSVTWAGDGSRLDVFATGATDGKLYEKAWFASTGWTGWADQGGSLLSAPSASWTRNGGRADVFAIGTDHRLYQRYWTATTGWSDWVSGFGVPVGGLEGAPGVTWTADGARLDIFVTGASDGRLYQKSWTDPVSWTGWTDMG